MRRIAEKLIGEQPELATTTVLVDPAQVSAQQTTSMLNTVRELRMVKSGNKWVFDRPRGSSIRSEVSLPDQ